MLPHPQGYEASRARGINDEGQVVGHAYLPNFPSLRVPSHAMLWQANGSVIPLNDRIQGGTGWVLLEARDIHNDGSIVGIGLLNGERRGFLLTPQPEEPATVAVIVNQALFSLGERLDVSIERSTTPADLHVAIIVPDGQTTLFLTNMETLSYIVSTIERGPYPVTGGRSLTHSWRGLEDSGVYHLVAALARPGSLADGRIDAGDLLALDWKAFFFLPQVANR
jgi:hypothetical protein